MNKQNRMPGRPRSESVKSALIDATFALFREQGYERLTMDAIAERAGVAKTTIYRWYQTKEELVIEALSSKGSADQVFVPDSGSLAGDLIALIEHSIRTDPLYYDRKSVSLTISALAGSAPLARTYWDLFVSKRRAAYAEMFQRAHQRREIASESDGDLILDLVHGYMLFGLLLRPKGSIDINVLKEVVAKILLAFKP
jgi:AcrR family transcriptional regulator